MKNALLALSCLLLALPGGCTQEGLVLESVDAGASDLPSPDAAPLVEDGLPCGAATCSEDTICCGELDVYSSTIGGAPAFSYELDRDAAGRVVRKSETIQGLTALWEYAYHPERGWLQEVKKDGVVVASYAYDPNGNRTSWTDFWGTSSAAYDAQDRLSTRDAASYSYTANGELASKTEGSDTTTYDYDALGNLRQVVLHANDPNELVIDYLIDGQNRRIGKKVNGTLVQGFLYEDLFWFSGNVTVGWRYNMPVSCV